MKEFPRTGHRETAANTRSGADWSVESTTVGGLRKMIEEERERERDAGEISPDLDAEQSHGHAHSHASSLAILSWRNRRRGEGCGDWRKKKRESVKGEAPNSDPGMLIEWLELDELTGWGVAGSRGQPDRTRLRKVGELGKPARKESCVTVGRGLAGPLSIPNRPAQIGRAHV